MKNNVWIILAAIIVCATYGFVELTTGQDVIVTPADDGVYIVNKRTGNVTFCYKKLDVSNEIIPVCVEGARVTQH